MTQPELEDWGLTHTDLLLIARRYKRKQDGLHAVMRHCTVDADTAVRWLREAVKRERAEEKQRRDWAAQSSGGGGS